MSSWNEYKQTMVVEGPLYDYARQGKTEDLLFYLDTLEDVNQKNTKGHSLLMLAAYNGHLELTKALIEKGADVNSQDLLGSTILMGIAFKGYLEIFKTLVYAGADININNSSNQSALDYALMFGRSDIASFISEIKKEKHKPVTGFFKSWYGFAISNKGA